MGPDTDGATASLAPRARGVIRWITLIANVMAALAGGGIFVLMLFTTLDVGMRTSLGSGIPGSIEITQVALVATVFAGMMSAELSKIHVRTPLLIERLPKATARVVKCFGSLVSATVVGWATYYSWRVALKSYADGEFQFGLAEVPIWPAKLALAVGLSGLLVSCLLDLYLCRAASNFSTPEASPSREGEAGR